MGNAATEAPAAYLLATQFHDVLFGMLDELAHEHLHLALELQKYAERIVGNVGAAEAPYATAWRTTHYGIAYSAACGCATGCEMVLRLGLAPADSARRATGLLRSLVRIIKPLAGSDSKPQSETEKNILDQIFDSDLEDHEEDTW